MKKKPHVFTEFLFLFVCSLSYHPGATPLKLFRATTWTWRGGEERRVVGREGTAGKGG